ncbi:uncharacterized protein C8A04DRAFT_26222 [Dichotomopilus funicola]|uniref:Uncharacterized protein n=1 Tax=Dichotomopilus funicola TaxID=1934379 RepID=A0AAN6ZNQ3_9PEZI|nr:hypothetical protein C8A04DRAFT_26222 [Dichotomopilus funicola]
MFSLILATLLALSQLALAIEFLSPPPADGTQDLKSNPVYSSGSPLQVVWTDTEDTGIPFSVVVYQVDVSDGITIPPNQAFEYVVHDAVNITDSQWVVGTAKDVARSNVFAMSIFFKGDTVGRALSTYFNITSSPSQGQTHPPIKTTTQTATRPATTMPTSTASSKRPPKTTTSPPSSEGTTINNNNNNYNNNYNNNNNNNNNNNGNNNNNNNNVGLSTAAAIGIGVGAGLAIILGSAGGWFLFRHLNSKRQGTQEAGQMKDTSSSTGKLSPSPSSGTSSTAGGGAGGGVPDADLYSHFYFGPESSGYGYGYGLGGGGGAGASAVSVEQKKQPYEMSAVACPREVEGDTRFPRYELDGLER